jgi:HAD superfamily hydrolase (TIGR01509 family)
MSLPRPVKAVIFDMDGLLIDSEPLVWDAMKETAATFGGEVPFSVFRRMIGLQHLNATDILVDHFGEGFDHLAWQEGVRGRFRARVAAGVRLKAGAAELVDHLDTLGLPRAIATSSGRGNVDISLTPDFRARFGVIITREDAARGKPHPEPFLKAAAALGVAPEDCLALEDSHNGVRAAAAAGMMTVMVPDLLDPTEEIAGLCHRVVADLHAVREMLA